MKNKKIVIAVVVGVIAVVLVLVVLLNTNMKTKKAEIGQNESSGTKIENVNYLKLDRTEDFDGDMTVVGQTSNFITTHYVIDKDFNILCSYTGNSTYIDGYMELEDENNKKTDIVDVNGNVVFSYGDYEYKEVTLVDNGCLIITKQTDTYNSSNIVTGVYSIKEQKYILEPDEKYVNKARAYGDDMLVLDDNENVYFNLKTKSIVKYQEGIYREFKDGYSASDDNDIQVSYLKVFDCNGNIKRIKSPYAKYEPILGKEQQNGMLFEVTSASEESSENATGYVAKTMCAIFNLETGETKDLTDEFWLVLNQPHYTKDGYALVMFQNKGGTHYYTVIDKQGNKLFEPQKVNDNRSFQPHDNGEARKNVSEDLQEGNYFIVKDNDVYKVLDKENNIVLTAEDGETFEGVTNGAVKVKWKKQGYYEQYYYKDLNGNKIGIKLPDGIKELNKSK